MTGAHIEPGALDRTLRSIDVSAIADTGLETALATVVDACHQLFTVDGCALLFLDGDRALQRAAASDPASAELEAVQEELGEGPCVETVVNDMLVHTRDVKVDERWPRLAARVVDQPVHGVLGVPVRHGGACLGALNVFRFSPYEWDETDAASLAAFATLVERLVVLAVLREQHGKLISQLESALESRVVIERAVGHLMATRAVDAVGAFDLLRRRARDERRKLADVALDVLSRH